ncbi:Hypothetical protein CINCED_3A011895 [Cinara cedri]|uniref:Uncharacterized protein n=1 Tax=Cinara cedri TaxID=506608 RepID=A0A5E4MQ95_9HEMI|nr:Hypothetical protein CINCED_3A011895 [Cinara cedri]
MTQATLAALSVDRRLGPITLTEAVAAWASGPGQSGSYLQSMRTRATVAHRVSSVSDMSMAASTAICPDRNSDRVETYSRQACRTQAASHSDVSATADRTVGPRNRNGCSRGSHWCGR